MRATTLYNKSLALLHGDGVPEDPVRSFQLNAEAAATGYHDAVLAMGWYYLNGIGVGADRDEAVAWYRKSARQGDSRAMFSLGQIAYCQHDFADAMRWFERAARSGHSRSTFWIGKLYWHGRGFPQDKKRAMGLFNDAAAKKVKEAQRALRWLSRN